MKTELLVLNRLNYLIRQKILFLNPEIKVLKPSEFNFLLFLYKSDEHELSLKDIEIEIQQSQSGVNEISLHLEKIGYIERFKDPEDKRRLKAKLTSAGLEYAKARDEESYQDELLLLDNISPSDREIYLKVASQLYDNSQKLYSQRTASKHEN